jgi:PAS domain S-box-containing protein
MHRNPARIPAFATAIGCARNHPLQIAAAALAMALAGCGAALVLQRGGWFAALIAALGLALLVLQLLALAPGSSRAVAVSERSSLQHEVEQYRRIFDTSLDLILVTDRGGLFFRVSPSVKTILGYEPAEMIGHVGTDFIHPDDLESTRSEMRLARRGREIRNFESRYLDKDGHAVTLTWTGVWDEAEQRHFFIGRDMTAQKRLERAERDAKETLAAVIDASPVAILCLAPDRRVIVWSRAAEQIFGYTAEETLGRPYPLVPPEGEREYDGLFERALAGETLRDIRVRRRRKDGTVIDISFDAAPMHDAGGIKAVAYALTDITERNKLEQQLRQAQKMESIGQLTGGIAHDFNNMLTVVTGTIDILAEAVADKPQLAAIAKLISEAADRGAELTGHLLAFARRQPLQPRETDINALMLESEKLLRPALGEDIDIELSLEEAAWPALIDPVQLTTALLNLAINARDAMADGGKLTLETGNVILDQNYADANAEVVPGNYVMVAVSDSGTGIPEDIRQKVFDPFFTTKEVGKGTGLGLSMVYGFVKQSGGHIKIYSEVGHGTTFKLYLPQAGAGAAQAAPSAVDQPLEGGAETILVVEDDATVRSSVVAQIDSLGYRTLAAAGAAEALAFADQGEAFDVLFTDVIMPGKLNGRLLAEELVRRRPGLKVLFTSGYTENAIIHHGRLDPGVLLLAKPYRKAELARMLRLAMTAGILPERPAEKSQATRAG